MFTALTLVALFTVATAVALVARRLRVPYTVALVVAGLVLGSGHVLTPPALTKELLFAVFLPGLIFEAAFALPSEELWHNKWVVSLLALPGVIIATLLTGFAMTPLARGIPGAESFTLGTGFLFAALVAATDPIAVVSLFKALGAPRRLRLLVEGESLLNDGTAVVVFGVVLAAITSGHFSISSALVTFVRVAGLGVLVGFAIGLIVSEVIRRVDDPMIETTLTTIAAYGSFVLAEHFHYSGVIATVTAGLLCGNYGARTGMSATTRIAVGNFWEYLAFALNSIVFLLIGFEVSLSALAHAWKPILVAYCVVTLGRALVTYAVATAVRKTREALPFKWAGALTWGGLRGGLSMVLVLSLPASMHSREILVVMTFGVVLLSILVQGSTMPFLLRKMCLASPSGAALIEYHRLRVVAKGAQAALSEIAQMVDNQDAHVDAVGTVQAHYQAKLHDAESKGALLRDKMHQLRSVEQAEVEYRALLAEKTVVTTEARVGRVSDETLRELIDDIDRRLVELQEVQR